MLMAEHRCAVHVSSRQCRKPPPQKKSTDQRDVRCLEESLERGALPVVHVREQSARRERADGAQQLVHGGLEFLRSRLLSGERRRAAALTSFN